MTWVIIMVFLFPCSSWAMRCGKGLVTVGDVKAKVLTECGKPQSRERVGSKETRYGHERRGGKKVTRLVEQWTYNCGEGDFIYVLTFEGGKLVKEEPVARGKGPSRCGGN